MIDIFTRALSLVAIIAIGQLIKRRGWVKTSDFPMFSLIVLRITLPCALATSFNSIVITAPLLGLTVFGLGVNFVMQGLGFLMERRASRQQQAFAVLNVGSYNIGTFTTPYVSGLMGPGAVAYTSMVDIGNSMAAGGFGYATAVALARGERPTPWRFLAHMFRSPIFLTYVGLLTFRLLGLHFPRQVLMFTGVVGGANTFLAMLMIGVGLQLDLSAHQFRAALKYLVVRYGVSIAVLAAAWAWQPFGHTATIVLSLVVFSPLAVMVSGFTAQIRGDVALSTFMTSVSVLVAVVAMPVLLGLLG